MAVYDCIIIIVGSACVIGALWASSRMPPPRKRKDSDGR